jgi:hypothetical protein
MATPHARQLIREAHESTARAHEHAAAAHGFAASIFEQHGRCDEAAEERRLADVEAQLAQGERTMADKYAGDEASAVDEIRLTTAASVRRSTGKACGPAPTSAP